MTGPDVAMAYLGDDIADEDAFGALTRRGLNVLVRDALVPRSRTRGSSPTKTSSLFSAAGSWLVGNHHRTNGNWIRKKVYLIA